MRSIFHSLRRGRRHLGAPTPRTPTGTNPSASLVLATERATLAHGLHRVIQDGATTKPPGHPSDDGRRGTKAQTPTGPMAGDEVPVLTAIPTPPHDAHEGAHAGEDTPIPAAICPHCDKAAGFLIDLEGAAYRVLEDPKDTDLLNDLTPDDLQEIGRAECIACGKKSEATPLLLPVLEALRAPRRVTIGSGRTKNRLHFAGKAALRIDPDGETAWPACPECGATHDFVIDLDGTAIMVLEDDDDTDLLRDGDATNLLCSRCSAVFDL